MEITLELTQKEASRVAGALEAVVKSKWHLSFDGTYEQLLSDVALVLRNATREVDDDYERLIFEEAE